MPVQGNYNMAQTLRAAVAFAALLAACLLGSASAGVQFDTGVQYPGPPAPSLRAHQHCRFKSCTCCSPMLHVHACVGSSSLVRVLGCHHLAWGHCASRQRVDPCTLPRSGQCHDRYTMILYREGLLSPPLYLRLRAVPLHKYTVTLRSADPDFSCCRACEGGDD